MSSGQDGGAAGAAAGVRAAVVRLARWLHRTWFGRLGLPLGVSIGVHAGIAAVLVVSAWSVRGPLSGGRAREEVVINIAPPPPASAAPAAPSEAAAPAKIAPEELPPPRLSGLSTPSMAAPPPVLRSATETSLTPGELMRREDESAIGATFAGLGARRASSVVYVVDASGAMVSSLKFVLAELERSVRSLSSGQRFQVVLFRDRGDGKGCEVFGERAGKAKMVAATPANKQALAQWLATITPAGKSNPIEGLRRGLALDPDAVFLLSRSIRRSSGSSPEGGVWGRPRDQTMAELEKLNPVRGGRRRVVIKAVQFLEEDPTGTMQAIGTEHGDGAGSYRVLTLQDLGAGAKGNPAVGAGAVGGAR